MATHSVHFGDELAWTQYRSTAPWRHRGKVRIVRYDEQRADFGREVQDPVVLVISAVMHGRGRVDRAATAVVGNIDDDGQVLLGSIVWPLQAFNEYPAGVVENMRRQPERELSRVHDDP